MHALWQYCVRTQPKANRTVDVLQQYCRKTICCSTRLYPENISLKCSLPTVDTGISPFVTLIDLTMHVKFMTDVFFLKQNIASVCYCVINSDIIFFKIVLS